MTKHYHSSRVVAYAARSFANPMRPFVGTDDLGPALRTRKAAYAECQQRADANPGDTFTLTTCHYSISECREVR